MFCPAHDLCLQLDSAWLMIGGSCAAVLVLLFFPVISADAFLLIMIFCFLCSGWWFACCRCYYGESGV